MHRGQGQYRDSRAGGGGQGGAGRPNEPKGFKQEPAAGRKQEQYVPKNREPTKEMYIPKKGEGDEGGEKEKPKKEEGPPAHTTQQHPQQQAPRQLQHPQQQQQQQQQQPHQPPNKAQEEKVIHRQFPALHSYPATIFLQGIIYGVSLPCTNPSHSATLTCLSVSSLPAAFR